MKNFYFLGIFLIVITSCGPKKAAIERQILYKGKKGGPIEPTIFWTHYDANHRGGVILVKPDGSYKIISENPPDAAVNSTIEALAKTDVGGKVDAAAKFSAVKSVAELGKRNAANYMIRDIAFRIETLSNNNSGEISPEVIDIYKKLIETTEKITIAETINSTVVAKKETLAELNSLIQLSQQAEYEELKLDSTFIAKIGEYIKN